VDWRAAATGIPAHGDPFPDYRGIAVMPNLNGLVNGRGAWEMTAACIVGALVWYVIRRSEH
jgi:hypothetical protein